MTKHTVSVTERCARYILDNGGYVGTEELTSALGIEHCVAQRTLVDMLISTRYDCLVKYVRRKIGPRTYRCRTVRVTAIRPDKKKAKPVRATSTAENCSFTKEYPSAYSTEVDGFDPATVLRAAGGLTKDNCYAGFKWEFLGVEE